MNIIRLSWSSYQSEENLQREAQRIRSLDHSYLRPRSSGPRPEKLTTYDVIIVNSQFTVGEGFLKQWDREGLLLTASSGYDHIDLAACDRLGVTVGRTPECRADNVCDYVRGSLHSLKRDFLSSGHPDRTDFWDRAGAYEAIQAFTDSTLGIVGFGVIGRRLPEYLDCFDFDEILVSDPLKRDTITSTNGVKDADLDELLADSDVVTLHADLNPTTQPLLDESRLGLMSPSSVLINASRGNMVNLECLLEALDRGEIGGAVLDVLPEEPPDNPDRLRRPNLMVTPHSAGFGPGLTETLTDEIVQNLEHYEKTNEPCHPVRQRTEEELDRLGAQSDVPA